MKWPQIERARGVHAREQGTIVKDWGGKTPIALLYPNTYSVGMSSLGLQQVYRLFNGLPDFCAERAFWDPRARDEPPIALESQATVSEFPYLGFSVSFELDYFHVIDMLKRAGISPLGADRKEDDPILLAGGPAVSANPLPLAPVMDAFLIGEIEPAFGHLTEAMRHRMDESRPEHLARLARVPGVYVPSVHGFAPPSPITRQWLPCLDDYPAGSVVLTRDTEFGDMVLIEIARGCGRGCRFCLAGCLYAPDRERSIESLLLQAREGMAFRRKIGLVSAAVSDYSRREELVRGLRDMGAGIAVSSLRADSLTDDLLAALSRSGTRTLTLAPEAGSERLRRIIGKDLYEDDILRAADMAARHRFPQLKLYFMIGLPGEAEADLEGIVRLTQSAAARFGRNVSITLSPFVPKAHTPYQRAAMLPVDDIRRRAAWLSGRLAPGRIKVHMDSAEWAAVQGVLARGGPELAPVLVASASPTLARWVEAMSAAGLGEQTYLGRWTSGRELPWERVVDARPQR
jgi:radical SAM superfamily enzyme YgiQ (UPF0313 family)